MSLIQTKLAISIKLIKPLTLIGDKDIRQLLHILKNVILIKI